MEAVDLTKLLIVAVDVLLWILAFVLAVSPEARFRLLACAALVLYVVLIMFLGIAVASAIWFGALWIFGIAAGMRGSEAGTS